MDEFLDGASDIKLVAFDLDDTLAESKSPITAEMAHMLKRLTQLVDICIISGGNDAQFMTQVVERLPQGTMLERFHLMPTCGTRYLRYRQGAWEIIYSHALSAEQKAYAIEVIEQAARSCQLWEDETKIRGERIEDRGSQITYSALGQQAYPADKKAWDPTGEKREKLRCVIAERLPNLEVRAGGSTSIDITMKGVDKAYGMRQLIKHSGIEKSAMVFIGDRLLPGGNDYPVYEMGVACHSVSNPAQTLAYLARLVVSIDAGL